MAANVERLSLAVQGDKEALVALLKQYGPAARKAVAGRIPARWRSVLSEDDILQQTYADATRTIRQFKSPEERAFGAFLAQTARRNLLDALKLLQAEKRNGHRRRIEPRNSDESYASLSQLIMAGTPTPSRVFARREVQSALGSGIKKLPGDYARVVKLYDLEELPVQEVAAALKRSPARYSCCGPGAPNGSRELMGTASKYPTSRS